MDKLMQVTCAPECGFRIRSHDNKEIMQMTREHVEHMHPDMKVSDSDIKAMMKAA